MLPQQFYPTDTTAQGFSLTASINNISDYGTNADDPLRPYTMGYVPYDEYPHFLDLTKISSVYVQGSENKITLESSTIPSNMPWGYVARTDSVFEHYSRSLFIYRDNDVWRPQFQLTNTGAAIGAVRMINAGYLATYTVTNYIRYQVGISLTYDDATAGNGTYAQMESTIQDFLDFCNGDATLDFVYNNRQYNISIDDFDERGYVITRNPEDTGNILIAICGPQWLDRGCGNGNGVNTQIIPYIAVPTEEGIHYEAFAGFPGGDIDIRLNVFTGNQPMDIYLSTGAGAYGLTRLYGASGTLKYDDTLSWAKAYNTQEWHYIPQLNMFRGFTGGNTFRLVPIFPPKQIKTLLELRLKTIKSLTAYTSYAPANHIYDTDINTNEYDQSNVPTGDILNGSYTQIVSDLRPWQLWQVDITTNDFNPDDIPPYSPPTPGDNENTGSDIIRPATLGVGGTNGFITQYALTASQIAEIGRLLWLSFANIDYYKNFLFTLTTTGSIDLANLLDYFVSLRVYPFPLINVPSWASAGQDMYIGAGFIPLHFSSTIHTINNYADYIDAGTCEIPRSYGDFRDLTHCEIMLYLPYCGTVQLNPADVVGGTLHAQYAIDFATGGCIAYVDLYTWDGRQFMIAALSGSIGADIPLTATNATQIAARIASNALNVAGTLGNGAAGVAAEVPTIAVGAATGNVPMAAMGAVGALGAEAGTAVGLAQDAMRIATQDAVKMPMMAGGRGFAGFGSPQTAYVQIRRGLYAEGHTAPQGFRQAFGDMYAKPVTVDSCTGFTVFANVDTSGLIAQADERDAIRSLMQSGIYI